MPISIPKFLQKAFAQNGGRQDVPVTGDTSGGRASYEAGFPPVTRITIVAGGIPPFGTDFNGVLYDLSQAIQYMQSGVAFPFNQDFATAIGGYEIGAIVSDASNKSLLWINETASNTTFPTGWTSFKYADPTEVVRGIPLVASTAEIKAGAVAGKMVSPSALKAFSSDSSTQLYGTGGTFTFTVPGILKSGAKKAYVVVVGAGGSSPAVTAGTGVGAAGGGSAEGFVDLTGVNTVTVTVGSPASAAAGGTSSFGSYMSATGGSPGAASSSVLPAGGVGTGGTLNRRGAAGGLQATTTGSATRGGDGGGSPYSLSVPGSAVGSNGYFPGGGASIGSNAGGCLGAVGMVSIKW